MPTPTGGTPNPDPTGAEATGTAAQSAHDRADLLARLQSGPHGIGTAAARLLKPPEPAVPLPEPSTPDPRPSASQGPAAPPQPPAANALLGVSREPAVPLQPSGGDALPRTPDGQAVLPQPPGGGALLRRAREAAVPLDQRGTAEDLPEGVEAAAMPPVASPAVEAAPYGFYEWGDGTHPPLYLPPLARDNPALGEAVDSALVEWAERMGLYEGRLDTLADTGYGQLVELAHADSDDVDSLLLAAQLNTVWWAADDYYADEADLGAKPEKLSERLSLVTSVFDPPVPIGGPYDAEMEEFMAGDPVLVATQSAVARMRRRATPDQLARVYDATAQMYVSWNSYAAWQHNGLIPEPWRYIAARQHDSFHTSMTLIDIVGGYEPPSGVVNSQDVRHAAMGAGLASVLVNDLHSLRKDTAEGATDFNLPTLIAHHTGCSAADAVAETVALHNRIVAEFEQTHAALRAIPSLQLQRYLSGLRNWMAGGFAWHARSSRYAATA